MPNPLITRNFKAIEIRVDGGKEPRIVGHAAVFNSLSEDMGFREIISPGAFSQTLNANPDVRFLINHDGLPLARTVSGTLSLSQDARGLQFNARLDQTDPDVQAVLPKVARGDLNQMSFAFRTLADEWQVQNGQDVRILKVLDLNDGDVSLVTYPAYQATNASLRSLNREEALKSRDMWKRGQHPCQTKINRMRYRNF